MLCGFATPLQIDVAIIESTTDPFLSKISLPICGQIGLSTAIAAFLKVPLADL